MQIVGKLPGLKNYLSENRLNNSGVKTSIDQSAVAASEEHGLLLDLQLDEKENSQESSNKNKKYKNKNIKVIEPKEVIQKSESDIKKHQLKLLNLL